MKKAVIFDIKGFAVHDGPGPRTTVFFKGCPLRCAWCHNPEGLSAEPQLCVREKACRHCGKCMQGCSHPECQPFGRCLYACPDACLSVCGREWTVEELAARLEKDRDFLTATGGGITFSGGEPTLYTDFILELAPRLRGLLLCCETSGYCTPDTFSRFLEPLDMVIMDVKLADPALHRDYTGVDNAPILKNLRHLQDSGKPHLIRTPLIPGVTDTEENLSAVAALVGSSPWEKLPYNTLAGAKYPSFGMKYRLDELTQKQKKAGTES